MLKRITETGDVGVQITLGHAGPHWIRLAAVLTAVAVSGCREPAPAGQVEDPRFPPLPLASNGLTLRAEVPPRIASDENFPIAAVFTYDGEGELAVLPRAIGVYFASRGPQRAEYVPLPGPPKDIYPDAQLIRRGQPVRAVVSFDVARWDSVWKLPEGPYELTLRYAVDPSTRLPEGSPLAGAAVWAGAVASPPVPITVTAP